IEPGSEAPGHRTQRAREDARAADLSHDPQRLSGTVRDLCGRPDVEPDLGPGQGNRPLCGKAGKRGRRKEQRWSQEALRPIRLALSRAAGRLRRNGLLDERTTRSSCVNGEQPWQQYSTKFQDKAPTVKPVG